jgi:mRNA interferase MazF
VVDEASPEFPRFSVWGVNLNPARGSEQAGYRPVLVISPDEMNRHLGTVIVAPMTSRLRHWPSRVRIRHEGKTSEVALEKLRTVDKSRLVRSMGKLHGRYRGQVLDVLGDMFAP